MLSASTEASRYAVLATDLDGTLLRSDGSVSPYTRDTLLQLASQHLSIVLVTARPIESTRAIALQVGASTAICLSGAITYDVASAHIQDSAPLEPSQIRLLRREVRRFCDHVAWGYETSRGRHVDQGWDLDNSGLSKERLTCLLGNSSGPRKDVLSMLMSCKTHEGGCLESWLANYGKVWGVAFSPAAGIVEVTTKTATKATALARYCRLRGVSARNVVAFGDSLNDLAMLQWVGLGIAMENAHSRLRETIASTALSNDSDGVAHALQTYLANQLEPSSAIRSCSSRLHQMGAARPA